MIKCSCLCGEVKFDILANPNHALNCHCQYCRKAHAAPYVTILVVMPDNLTITQGSEKLLRRPADKQKTGRYSCQSCGSNLYTESAPGSPVSVHTSTLENEQIVKIMAHTNVGSMSPAVEVSDSLPQFNGLITKEDYMQLIS